MSRNIKFRLIKVCFQACGQGIIGVILTKTEISGIRTMKKLPLGIQNFEKIRKDSFVYIDKTPLALRLVDEGTYYFLSRPRRFGKSLFLDTLKCMFEGRKELFEGLYII